MIEQRLGEAVALLLLAGGEDDRRTRELGVVERPERVAEAGRDVDVGGSELAGRARKTVGHGDDKALLHRHDVVEIGVLGERVHDRQFGRTGVAEQVRYALVL